MDTKADVKADIKAAEDRGELVSLMEPLLLAEGSRHRPGLTDLALDLAQKSSGFRRSLPESLLASLADLVRAMNCYYSNLIEGHDTHPVDIERALKNDYSKDARKRDLQLEARAHIAVQKWIDGGGITGRAVTSDGIREIHRRFCEELPDDLLWVEDPVTKERVRVVPGALRTRDVRVGDHIAISPGAVPRFMKRFEEVYGAVNKTESILGAAEALDGLSHSRRVLQYLRKAHDRHGVLRRNGPPVDLLEEFDQLLVAAELGVVVLDVARGEIAQARDFDLVDDGLEDPLARGVLVPDRDQHELVLAVLVGLVAEPDRRGLAPALELVGEDRGVEVEDLHGLQAI